MSTASHFDVIIIGTGAGGGTLAHALADSGKRILLVERGEVIPREPDNWDAAAVYGRGKYRAADVWHDDARRPIHPQTCYAVGGNTKVYGAALMRMRLADFRELRHADGSSPAWPIGYDDLEPFYARAESLYHVHGSRGEDPTEPPASGPFPHPPVSHEPHVQRLVDALQRAGCRPFHLPLGLLLDESDAARSPCIRCSSCDGYPCMLGAKADSEVVAVVPATAQPNVTLLTGARATRL